MTDSDEEISFGDVVVERPSLSPQPAENVVLPQGFSLTPFACDKEIDECWGQPLPPHTPVQSNSDKIAAAAAADEEVDDVWVGFSADTGVADQVVERQYKRPSARPDPGDDRDPMLRRPETIEERAEFCQGLLANFSDRRKKLEAKAKNAPVVKKHKSLFGLAADALRTETEGPRTLRKITGCQLGLLTEREVIARGHHMRVTSDKVTTTDQDGTLKLDENGLVSPKMGPIERDKTCHCGGVYNDDASLLPDALGTISCPGHSGYYISPGALFVTPMMPVIKKMLGCICPNCGEIPAAPGKLERIIKKVLECDTHGNPRDCAERINMIHDFVKTEDSCRVCESRNRCDVCRGKEQQCAACKEQREFLPAIVALTGKGKDRSEFTSFPFRVCWRLKTDRDGNNQLFEAYKARHAKMSLTQMPLHPERARRMFHNISVTAAILLAPVLPQGPFGTSGTALERIQANSPMLDPSSENNNIAAWRSLTIENFEAMVTRVPFIMPTRTRPPRIDGGDLENMVNGELTTRLHELIRDGKALYNAAEHQIVNKSNATEIERANILRFPVHMRWYEPVPADNHILGSLYGTLQYRYANFLLPDTAQNWLPNGVAVNTTSSANEKKCSPVGKLKGKEGRLRGNLTGKRVDFSARSVITPDPSLSIDEIGIPREMACILTVPDTLNAINCIKVLNAAERRRKTGILLRAARTKYGCALNTELPHTALRAIRHNMTQADELARSHGYESFMELIGIKAATIARLARQHNFKSFQHIPVANTELRAQIVEQANAEHPNVDELQRDIYARTRVDIDEDLLLMSRQPELFMWNAAGTAKFDYMQIQHSVLDHRCAKETGARVDRPLQDGDWVAFNRAPSLHGGSFMAHKTVLHNGRTLTFNPCNCGPYNADFDGDEMNVHVPQTELARVELIELMPPSRNIVLARSSAPIIALVQDFLLGIFKMSMRDMFFNWRDAMDVLVVTTSVRDDKDIYDDSRLRDMRLPWPAVSITCPKCLDCANVEDMYYDADGNTTTREELYGKNERCYGRRRIGRWTGKQLLSLTLPRWFSAEQHEFIPEQLGFFKPGVVPTAKQKATLRCGAEPFRVCGGDIVTGTLGKSAVGVRSQHNIVHQLLLSTVCRSPDDTRSQFSERAIAATKRFIDYSGRMSLHVMRTLSTTISMDDLRITSERTQCLIDLHLYGVKMPELSPNASAEERRKTDPVGYGVAKEKFKRVGRPMPVVPRFNFAREDARAVPVELLEKHEIPYDTNQMGLERKVASLIQDFCASEALYAAGERNSEMNHTLDTAGRVEKLEDKIFAETGRVKEAVRESFISTLSMRNGLQLLVTAGTKGSNINNAMMCGCIGQQDVGGKRLSNFSLKPWENDRKLDDGNNDSRVDMVSVSSVNPLLMRWLPCTSRGIQGAAAGGFVHESYRNGVTALDLFNMNYGGRVGLSDTATKTAETGYIQRRMIKLTEDLHLACDDTVRDAANRVCSFAPGGVKLDQKFMLTGVCEPMRQSDNVFENCGLITENDAMFTMLCSDDVVKAKELAAQEAAQLRELVGFLRNLPDSSNAGGKLMVVGDINAMINDAMRDSGCGALATGATLGYSRMAHGAPSDVGSTPKDIALTSDYVALKIDAHFDSVGETVDTELSREMAKDLLDQCPDLTASALAEFLVLAPWRAKVVRQTTELTHTPLTIEHAITRIRDWFHDPIVGIDDFDSVTSATTRLALSAKQLIARYQLTVESLDTFLDNYINYLRRACLSPGEAVGVTSAQSVGEPLTQLTMQTFYAAGSSSAMMNQGVPRAKELVDATQTTTMRTPMIAAHINKQASQAQIADNIQASILSKLGSAADAQAAAAAIKETTSATPFDFGGATRRLDAVNKDYDRTMEHLVSLVRSGENVPADIDAKFEAARAKWQADLDGIATAATETIAAKTNSRFAETLATMFAAWRASTRADATSIVSGSIDQKTTSALLSAMSRALGETMLVGAINKRLVAELLIGCNFDGASMPSIAKLMTSSVGRAVLPLIGTTTICECVPLMSNNVWLGVAFIVVGRSSAIMEQVYATIRRNAANIPVASCDTALEEMADEHGRGLEQLLAQKVAPIEAASIAHRNTVRGTAIDDGAALKEITEIATHRILAPLRRDLPEITLGSIASSILVGFCPLHKTRSGQLEFVSHAEGGTQEELRSMNSVFDDAELFDGGCRNPACKHATTQGLDDRQLLESFASSNSDKYCLSSFVLVLRIPSSWFVQTDFRHRELEKRVQAFLDSKYFTVMMSDGNTGDYVSIYVMLHTCRLDEIRNRVYTIVENGKEVALGRRPVVVIRTRNMLPDARAAETVEQRERRRAIHYNDRIGSNTNLTSEMYRREMRADLRFTEGFENQQQVVQMLAALKDEQARLRSIGSAMVRDHADLNRVADVMNFIAMAIYDCETFIAENSVQNGDQTVLRHATFDPTRIQQLRRYFVDRGARDPLAHVAQEELIPVDLESLRAEHNILAAEIEIGELERAGLALKSFCFTGAANARTVEPLDSPTIYYSSDGGAEFVNDNAAAIDSRNFLAVLGHRGINQTTTKTNSIHDAANVLGIEAARALWIEQYTEMLSSGNSGVTSNHCNLALLADRQTMIGIPTPMTRNGARLLLVDPLQSASFESTADVVINAAVANTKIADIVSPSTAMMFALPMPRFGTSASDVMADGKMLERIRQEGGTGDYDAPEVVDVLLANAHEDDADNNYEQQSPTHDAFDEHAMLAHFTTETSVDAAEMGIDEHGTILACFSPPASDAGGDDSADDDSEELVPRSTKRNKTNDIPLRSVSSATDDAQWMANFSSVVDSRPPLALSRISADGQGTTRAPFHLLGKTRQTLPRQSTGSAGDSMFVHKVTRPSLALLAGVGPRADAVPLRASTSAIEAVGKQRDWMYSSAATVSAPTTRNVETTRPFGSTDNGDDTAAPFAQPLAFDMAALTALQSSLSTTTTLRPAIVEPAQPLATTRADVPGYDPLNPGGIYNITPAARPASLPIVEGYDPENPRMLFTQTHSITQQLSGLAGRLKLMKKVVF